MAIILPADRPPGDTRPVYNENILPGGPWNRYRPRTWVNAHLLNGPFLILLGDGRLQEMTGPIWVVQNQGTGAISLVQPAEFSATYELVE